MRILLLAMLVWLVCGAAYAAALPSQTPPAETPRFATVDLIIVAAQPLAAYQLEFTATSGDVRIVGIEGGDHAAFSEPPHYDPRAMMHDRVIIGAFSLVSADALPSGRVRVATLHLEIRGAAEPDFEVTLDAAATTNGASVDATVLLVDGESE